MGNYIIYIWIVFKHSLRNNIFSLCMEVFSWIIFFICPLIRNHEDGRCTTQEYRHPFTYYIYIIYTNYVWIISASLMGRHFFLFGILVIFSANNLLSIKLNILCFIFDCLLGNNINYIRIILIIHSGVIIFNYAWNLSLEYFFNLSLHS